MSIKKVMVGDVECGADKLFLISGPCVIESEKIMMDTAETLKRVSEDLDIPLIYKSSFQKDNRSSVDYYMGPGIDEGLKILQRVKEDFGFPLLTDIHYPDQVEAAAEVVDVLQIPAYLVMQTTLAVAAANTGKVINLKHAQFLAPENMSKPVAKVESTGNKNILLTERGYAFGYNDLVVDPRAFHHMRETGYPTIFDVTHSIRKYGIPSSDPSGGARQYLDVLGRAGVAAGVDGIFVEAHPCPSEALCDAASQMDMTQLKEYLKPLIEMHELEVKYRK
ncbi:MAG: 2-dehydro-3-deoxyphosphooctonate aldolase (KDO 8-P synthase) [Salibacteraceae bacterium]|jgi:2-dehydro-3-deoxyphosphooctonate aldolase (KDO 8-P synthase)